MSQRRSKYIQLYEDTGEIDITTARAMGFFKLACCDCGLTHLIGVVKRGNTFGVAIRPAQQSTAQLRRWRKYRCRPR